MAINSFVFVERKTILIVRPNDNIGGSQRMADHYHVSLSEIGYYVVMITLTGKEKGLRKDDHKIVLNQSRSIYALFKLKEVIDVLKPEFILGFQFQVNKLLAIIALFNPRKKWTYVMRESNLQNYINSGYLHRVVVQFIYSMADKIIAQCMDMKKHIIHYYGVSETKIYIIYNFPVYEYRQPTVRRNILLVASTLSKQKNIRGALDLWAAQKSCQEEFHIYGYNKNRLKELQDYVMRHNIPNVIFKGLIEKVPYEAYKLLLVNSFFEGFSNAVLESISCGTPVLSVKYQGGITEVIDGSNGLIFTRSEIPEIGAIANRNWDNSSIMKSAKNTFNKVQFKSSCERVFHV